MHNKDVLMSTFINQFKIMQKTNTLGCMKENELNPVALRRLILAITIGILSVILVAVILGKIE